MCINCIGACVRACVREFVPLLMFTIVVHCFC